MTFRYPFHAPLLPHATGIGATAPLLGIAQDVVEKTRSETPASSLYIARSLNDENSASLTCDGMDGRINALRASTRQPSVGCAKPAVARWPGALHDRQGTN